MITKVNAQLGFCLGNSGDPIFTEDFGTASGTGVEHTPLPLPGQTSYTFLGFTVFGDGKYTVTNLNYQQWNWFMVDDHTVGDTNGRMLIVNASFTPGEFFRIPITGLCENTTYEFSSWLMNLTPRDLLSAGRTPNPCNVRFEIWDSLDTTLLKSGDTGDFLGNLSTETGAWRDFGLVFQTLVGQTSVILKMVNNGTGGYGNDLAIDDIVFKSCGDAITVSDGSSNNITICSSQTPYATTLSANPDGAVFGSHFYQWQQSSDGNTWINIAGETNQNIMISGINATSYYRTKVAEFSGNLSNSQCNTLSDVFQVRVNQASVAPNINCWETAKLNENTCTWDVTGIQPLAPTGLECWETVTFDTTSCSWQVTGTQPMTPTGLECWETLVFNTTSCSWSVGGTQPVQPAIDCWETVTFDTTSCSWEVAGTQPMAPTGLECWETPVFNKVSCSWEVTGTQPTQPVINCWQTTAFNTTTCIWETSGVKPIEPVRECWETVTFNTISCSWGITGTQPVVPTGLQCWQIATFDNASCTWNVSGIQPVDELNISFCENENVVLEPITGATNPTYLWSTGETTEIITVDIVGVYEVEVTDNSGCLVIKRAYTVTQKDNPIIESIKSDGNDIVIRTANTGNFLYSIDGSIFQLSNIFENIEGGEYTIYVKEQSCGKIVSGSFIHFYIPKFFTPNNDGVHDTFDLKGVELYEVSQVSIFDRYGKLLKSAVNSSFSWNGSFNNKLLPTGDYWYIIIIDNQKMTGHFTLKR
ncbi:T9SS type B sorting domain-containing protein [Flavivirga aquatica]|uniref:T9SS type B sorting domain-containing protein n=1 Tax=Flavivirga aquatica TaxID=1849968 RepID=UPI0013F4F409|nr:T9SS type B sorting domain-containing protein [Flavivirga aquatica]